MYYNYNSFTQLVYNIIKIFTYFSKHYYKDTKYKLKC